MGKILEITANKQEYPNSCWAACIRMVMAYDGSPIPSDETVALKCGVSPNECQDVAIIMDRLDIFDSTDDEEIVPKFDEIKEEIDKGRPIIQCVSTWRK